MVIVVPRGVRRRVRWTRNGPPGWFGSSGSAWPRSPMGQGCVQRNCHVAHHAVEEIVADVALEQFGAQQADRGEHRLLGDVCRSQLAAVSFRLPSWFSPYLDGLRSGFGTRARNEVWSDRSQCSIHDVTSLIAFLLVWYILLVDEFFPARVALNDICCCVVVAHAGSSHRCEETILVHGGGVVSGRVLRSLDST